MWKLIIAMVALIIVVSGLIRFRPDDPAPAATPSTVYIDCPDCIEEAMPINLFKTADLDGVACQLPPNYGSAGKVLMRSSDVVKVRFTDDCTGWLSLRMLRSP